MAHTVENFIKDFYHTCRATRLHYIYERDFLDYRIKKSRRFLIKKTLPEGRFEPEND